MADQNPERASAPTGPPQKQPPTSGIDLAIAEQLLGYKAELDKFARIIVTSDIAMTRFLLEAIDKIEELATGQIEASQLQPVIRSLIIQLNVAKTLLSSVTQSSCGKIINELEAMVVTD